MFMTEEVSLVEFYQSCLHLVKKAGYSVLLCFIAREADAPDAYDDLVKQWESIDDLTGPDILFLFAGRSVRERQKSDNIISRDISRVIFSPDMLMLHSKMLLHDSGYRFRDQEHEVLSHIDLCWLQENTDDKYHFLKRNIRHDLHSVARYQPAYQNRNSIALQQTSQIRSLRDYLGLNEKDIPCLHFTFFDEESTMNYKIFPDTNIYELLKAIVEAAGSQDMRKAKAELFQIRRRQDSLIRCEHERKNYLSILVNKLSKLVDCQEKRLKHIMLSIKSAISPTIVDNNQVQNLIHALELHVQQQSYESRKAAFDCLKSARTVICESLNGKQIRSDVQRLISVADHSIDESIELRKTMIEIKDQKHILSSIIRDREHLEFIIREQERRVEAMRSSFGIAERMRRTVLARTGAFLNSFVVVAARQELEAARDYLDSIRANRVKVDLSENWSAERVSINNGRQIEFVLILARGQGLESMHELLNFIHQEAKPKNIILVGMMAAISGKSKLLDVQSPRNIINGIRLGTRNGSIVPEPQGNDVDPILHNRLQSLDKKRRNISDIPLITNKHTLCVAAKFDDLTPELARAALATDPENIIGIEMEGSALTARQAGQRLMGEATGYLMIKGVADYAGVKLSQDDISMLRPIMEPFEGSDANTLFDDPDPTTNKSLKSLLQKIATIRAIRVALALLEESASSS